MPGKCEYPARGSGMDGFGSGHCGRGVGGGGGVGAGVGGGGVGGAHLPPIIHLLLLPDHSTVQRHLYARLPLLTSDWA